MVTIAGEIELEDRDPDHHLPADMGDRGYVPSPLGLPSREGSLLKLGQRLVYGGPGNTGHARDQSYAAATKHSSFRTYPQTSLSFVEVGGNGRVPLS
jgi:hypothetical protein